MARIGIPRGLYYFHYYPLWQSYLEALDFEVIFSPPTNKKILEWGLQTCIDGACLPIKAYVGHALALVQEGVEILFVPQIISVQKKEYICPSFLGLPDLLVQYLPASTKLISPALNGLKGPKALQDSYWRFGLEYASLNKVKSGWKKAVEAQQIFEKTNQNSKLESSQFELKILLLGPRYLLDDSFLNGNLVSTLEQLGAEVVMASQIDEQISKKTNRILSKPLYWTEGRRSIGALEHFLNKLDGVVSVAPFGCGAEALFSVILEQYIKRKIPKLILLLDEHTSELGMLTRLEAFCDLLERKNWDESHLSTSRQ